MNVQHVGVRDKMLCELVDLGPIHTYSVNKSKCMKVIIKVYITNHNLSTWVDLVFLNQKIYNRQVPMC